MLVCECGGGDGGEIGAVMVVEECDDTVLSESLGVASSD